MVFAPLVTAIPAARSPNGCRHTRPRKLHAGQGDDVRRCQRFLCQCKSTVRIVRKGGESKANLGRHRRMVERPLEWLNHF